MQFLHSRLRKPQFRYEIVNPFNRFKNKLGHGHNYLESGLGIVNCLIIWFSI